MANMSSWPKKFSYNAMRQLVGYLQSRNMASQVLAEHGTNHENIKTTGTASCVINGVLIPSLAARTEYDISAELPYAAWASSQSYTLINEVIGSRTGSHYVCILAHTSAAVNEPEVGADWETYWKKLDKYAVQAAGDIILTATTKYYLVCALSTGVLRLFKAYNSALALQIPAYDPERYVAVGMISVANATGSDFTVGTTAFNTGSVTTTYYQITYPLLPDGDLVDVN